MQRLVAFSAALIVVAVAGCADVAGPDWFDPGTARQQRTRAQRFDPYPDPYVAHDDGSARPRDYLVPPPESDRAARSINPASGAGFVPDRWQAGGP